MPTYGTKEEKGIKFGEVNDALNHSLLEDNQLYLKSMKRYQCERRVVFEYVAADVKWKEQHCELEHVRNNRKFRKINEFCYEVHNRWLNGI